MNPAVFFVMTTGSTRRTTRRPATRSLRRYVTVLVGAGLLAAGVRPAVATPFTRGNLAVFQADAATANNTTFTILEIAAITANQSSPVNAIPIDGANPTNALRSSGSAASTGYLADSDDGTLLLFTGHNANTVGVNVNTLLPRGVGTLDNAGNFALQTVYTGGTKLQTRCATTTNNALYVIADQGGLYTNNAAAAALSGNYRSVKSFGGRIYALSATAGSIIVSEVLSNGTVTVGLPGLGSDTSVDFYMVSSGANGPAFDVLYLIATSGTLQKLSWVGGTWTANGVYSTSFGGFGLCAATNDAGGTDLYVTSGAGALAGNAVQKLTDTAGYNAVINIAAAPVTLYTASSSASLKGIAFAPQPVAAPTLQASAVNFTAVTTNAMTVNWTPGNGSRRIVVVKAGGAASWTPTDGAIIGGVNADLSVAADQGNGNKVCYDGPGTNFTLAGLSAGTTYYVEIFEYNGLGVTAKYLTSGSPATGSQTAGGAPSDGDSSLWPPVTQIGSLDISSLRTSPTSAVAVFCFTIQDNGSGDNLPTAVTQITLRPGTNNTAAWSKTLQGAVLSSFVQAADVPVTATSITDSALTFTLAPTALSVSDGGSDDLTLAVYLKVGVLQDNSVLQFAIPATNSGFVADPSGSQFTNLMSADVVSATSTIRVVASQLSFAIVPSVAMAGVAFPANIVAQDSNGNTDLDATQAVTLVQTGGSATLTGGGSHNLSAGVAAWSTLQASVPGTLVLQARAAGLASATSATITVVQAPVLQAGDVAAVGFDDQSASADIFAVVALRPIPAGTIIYFTDNGWSSSSGLFRGASATSGAGSEGLCKLTTLASIPAGTIIQAYSNTALYAWTTNGTIPGATSGSWGPLNFAKTGDQFSTFVSATTNNPLYNTAYMEPLYLFDDTKGFEDATDSATGGVPPGLSTNAFTAITFSTADTWALNVTDGSARTKAQWLKYIADPSHWTSGTNGVMPSSALNVRPDNVYILSIR